MYFINKLFKNLVVITAIFFMQEPIPSLANEYISEYKSITLFPIITTIIDSNDELNKYITKNNKADFANHGIAIYEQAEKALTALMHLYNTAKIHELMVNIEDKNLVNERLYLDVHLHEKLCPLVLESIEIHIPLIKDPKIRLLARKSMLGVSDSCEAVKSWK